MYKPGEASQVVLDVLALSNRSMVGRRLVGRLTGDACSKRADPFIFFPSEVRIFRVINNSYYSNIRKGVAFMRRDALLWLKVGDTISDGLDSHTLIYRELKDGHFYGLLWGGLLDLGSVVRLDDCGYILTVFDKEDGIEFIKEHDSDFLDSYL